jgi:hypothetical protein
LQTFARVDGGVGVFGNKAGMTQIFTDDGLCVPVTVIAVKDGNYVSAVSLFVAFKNFISTGNPGVFLGVKNGGGAQIAEGHSALAWHEED